MIVVLLASSPAFAFVPGPGTRAEPQRVRWFHGETQGLHLAGPAWTRFVETDGRGWEARFDEVTGTPRWMWGAGIPISGGAPDEILDQVGALLERHRELLGFEALDRGVARYDARVDTWYVEYAPLRDGAPTWRGGISARIKHGNLILMSVRTAPRAPVAGAWTLSPEQAIGAAIADGPAPSAVHDDRSAAVQLLEVQGPHGLVLERTWKVQSRTEDPPGIWVSFVSAATGEVLSVHNELPLLDGAVTGLHHARTPEQPPAVTSPMPLVFVTGDVDDALADTAGLYTILPGGPYETDLHGDYVTVVNAAGADGTLSGDDPDLHWTSDAATQAEIDTYVFAHQVRVWGEALAGPIGIVANPLTATVNIDDTCNAFYDSQAGTINFFRAGDGCSNMGQIADVVYHEWGHGFHHTIIQGGVVDRSVGEAAGDTVGSFMTGDSALAPYFHTDGTPVRDLAPDLVYPQDLTGEVHNDGLTYGGANWDLWEILRDDLGDAAGTAAAEAIFAGTLRAGPTLPDTYFEALVADDDDGDLANGTPNDCRIHEAFDRHGLALPGRYIPVHTPLTFAPDGVPTEVEVTLVQTALACVVGVPGRAAVHFRVDGGPWQQQAATVVGSDVTGEIPAQPFGSFVEYWLGGDDDDGAVWHVPASGDWAPYSFFAGGVIPIVCEDFEATDGGFTHALIAGVDDWEWGAPAGEYSDPATGFSGSNVWGNDLGVGVADGRYDPLEENELTSAMFDTVWYTDVFLQYRRWLTVEDGYYDQARITVNDEPVWVNHDGGSELGGQHHQDEQWVSHVVDLRGFADRALVELGWELHTDGGLELGGWNIDDVCLYAAATPDNRLAIVDFAVEDVGGPIGLSWTNPIHAPLTEVVVVRRLDDWPTSHEDGDLVATVTAPVLGELVEAVHDNVDGASGFYAAYAFDGTDWLSWTFEGWNAAHADPNEGVPVDPGDTDDPVDTGDPVDTDDPVPDDPDGSDEDEGGTCGCDASGASGGLALWPVLGLVWLRRRSVMGAERPVG